MNAEFDDDDLRLDSGAGSQIAGGVSRRWPRPRWLPGSDDEAEQGDMTDPGRPTSQEGSEDDGDEIMASASPSRSADPGLSEEERAIIHGAIVRCYREVWTEFYEWEPYDSLQTLRSLSTVTVPAGPHYSLDDGDWSLYAVGDAQATDTGPEDRLTVDTESKFEVCEWDSEGTLYERTVPVSVLHSSSQVIPHPPYEACAPTYASIDPNLYSGQPECRFIKYAGQPGFNERDYLRKFHSISWQQPWRDSDQHVIASVAIQRLTSWTKEEVPTPLPIYVDDIDDSKVFQRYQPKSAHAADDEVSGILYKMRQRHGVLLSSGFEKDAIHKYKPVWRSAVRAQDEGRIAALAAAFCPELDCLRASCIEHPYPTGWVRLASATTTKPHEEFLTYTKREPCGSKCYRVLHTPEIQDSIDWDKEPELYVLDLLLSLEPRMLPCSCRTLLPQMECYKVFARRCQNVEVTKSLNQRKAIHPPAFIDNCVDSVQLEKFTMPTRCAHRGPCGSLAEPACPCYDAQVHCRRNCQCDAQCVLRHMGCECGKKKSQKHSRDKEHKNDAQEPCQCESVLRECDAEKCIHDEPKSRKNAIELIRPNCNNMNMQLPPTVPLVVKGGVHGLGAFAGANIKENIFLGEYVGDLFGNSDATHREVVQNWSHRNYSFGLNDTQNVDAAATGNETRYLNHAPHSDANVIASSKLVNGRHKIGFFTTKNVAKGQELLFDYGERYWNSIRK